MAHAQPWCAIPPNFLLACISVTLHPPACALGGRYQPPRRARPTRHEAVVKQTLKSGNDMHRLQVIVEVGRMYADPYTRAVTRRPRLAAGVTGFSLFASVAAFIACALPVLIAMFGPATAMAALTKTAPWLAAVEHKHWIFGISGLLLLLAAVAIWHARCPHTLYPEITRQCRRVRHLNRWMLRISAGLWLAGILGAYIVTPVRLALGG